MRYRIGITMGDPAGIGAEIAVKILMHKTVYETSIPVIYGDYSPIAKAIEITKANLKLNVINDPSEAKGEYGTIDLFDLALLNDADWKYGVVSAKAGNAAFHYVVTAIEQAMEAKIDAVVTGPINKEALNLAGHHFSGHTEIFAHYTNSRDYAMLLTTPQLKVIHVTTHVSMRNACDRITEDRVYNVIRLANEAMKDLGIEKPRIGVAGLNAHCSENGLFGTEEEKSIRPAVLRAAAAGVSVDGPVPPDTVFVKAIGGAYDAVVAMYHDQGHIPIKLVGFKMDPETKKFVSVQGVNITVGLPIIRTSVDHGTAFDKAGDGSANEESLLDAVRAAVCMAQNKKRRIENE